MKKAFCLLIATVILGVLLVGCTESGDSDFTIEVSGSSGLEFSGNYMVVTSEGQSTSKSVDGIVPARYDVRGNIVLCTFQKQSEYGILRVEILRGADVVAQSETSAAYGIVSAATD